MPSRATPNERLFANVMQLDLHRWRDDLVAVFLRVTFILGVLVCIPSVYLAIEHDHLVVAIGDLIGITVIAFLRFARHLRFTTRAGGLIAVLYLIAALLLVNIGPISQIYLLAFSLTTTFLFGHRAGLAAIAINALTLTAVGITDSLAPGFVAPPMPGDTSGWAGWFVVMLNFALIDIALVATISSVLATLENGVEREAQARLSLQRSEALLSMSLRVGRFGAWDLALPGRQLNWASISRGRETFDGARLATIDAAFSACVPQDSDRLASAIARCISGGESFDLEVRLKGIEHAWVRWMGEARRNDRGTIVGVQGALQDITDQKEAERALRNNERRLAEQAELLEKAQDAIHVRDLEGRVTYLNRRAETLYAWPSSAVIDTDVRLLQFQSAIDAYDHATLATVESGAWTGELALTCQDGRQVVVESRWTLLRREDGEPYGVMSIDTDVTDKKRLEEQLLRAQRLESIGTLAGGIAHDLNNVITPIMMAAEMLRMGDLGEEHLADINTIEVCARRASDMVRQIVGFARGYEGKRAEVDVRRVLSELAHMMRETLPKNVEVVVASSPDTAGVIGDSTQLSQVLMNLCVNARDAMPSGGKLTVTAENAQIDDVYARLNPGAKPGRYVALRVVDTGTGMAPDTLARVYEPFFTTKEVGKGTGLGLFTTHAIVKGHDGFITVYSELGAGTSFHIYLPAVESTQAAPAITSDLTTPTGQGECILVVDDEDRVRDMVCRTLERHGYRVRIAHNGAEGTAVFAQHKDDIALVLTDMSMPIMDGPKLVMSLRFIAPDVKVIGSSGLTRPSPETPGTRLDDFLPKPYTAETLLNAVRALLDRGTTP